MVYEMTFRSRRKNVTVQYGGTARLCKTWKIPVYLKVIGTFALEIFWIERIMRRTPCIFCELRGCRIYTASFYFAERGAPLFAVWVEYLRWVCWGSMYSRELSICTQTRGGGRGRAERRGRGVCISAFPLDALTKVRMHFYKLPQADILVTLLDPYLNFASYP
jgi:hypothetical protein